MKSLCPEMEHHRREKVNSRLGVQELSYIKVIS